MADSSYKNGHELWDAILAQMPKGSVIAGGAVRDYLLGVEPKDIDVFMPVRPVAQTLQQVVTQTTMPLADLTVAASTNYLPGFVSVEDAAGREARDEIYASLTGIAVVSRGEMFGRQIDAIEMVDFNPDTLLDNFDFGITRAMYRDGRIDERVECILDRTFKTVTLYIHEDWRRERHGGDWELRA